MQRSGGNTYGHANLDQMYGNGMDCESAKRMDIVCLELIRQRLANYGEAAFVAQLICASN